MGRTRFIDLRRKTKKIDISTDKRNIRVFEVIRHDLLKYSCIRGRNLPKQKKNSLCLRSKKKTKSYDEKTILCCLPFIVLKCLFPKTPDLCRYGACKQQPDFGC